MRSSTFLAVICAGLATASPMVKKAPLVKKALVTEVVTEYEYVFVTPGQPEPTQIKAPVVVHVVSPSRTDHPTRTHNYHRSSSSPLLFPPIFRRRVTRGPLNCHQHHLCHPLFVVLVLTLHRLPRRW
jgi:hypothetical protein